MWHFGLSFSQDCYYELRLMSRSNKLLSEPSESVNISTFGKWTSTYQRSRYINSLLEGCRRAVESTDDAASRNEHVPSGFRFSGDHFSAPPGWAVSRIVLPGGGHRPLTGGVLHEAQARAEEQDEETM